MTGPLHALTLWSKGQGWDYGWIGEPVWIYMPVWLHMFLITCLLNSPEIEPESLIFTVCFFFKNDGVASAVWTELSKTAEWLPLHWWLSSNQEVHNAESVNGACSAFEVSVIAVTTNSTLFCWQRPLAKDNRLAVDGCSVSCQSPSGVSYQASALSGCTPHYYCFTWWRSELLDSN